ncbi:MAG: hydantoinase/oxoprolinase family protein, partial [Pseudomonadota bacterium]|nr:hydantoinase/oxoprolinase family protein [Pseudomonadota bacterium]
ARAAVGRLAARLGMTVIEDVALGIVAIANEHMANALRVISLHRGLDPRRFPLFCFGGAGGLHVCDLARALGIRETLVPRDAGVLSALGMLAASSGRQLSRTLSGVLIPARRREIGVALRTLAEDGLAAMAGERIGLPDKSYLRAYPSLDLCYRGQAHTLNVPWQGSGGRALEAFHQAHERRYGHRLGTPVELVNLRVALRGPAARLRLARPPSGRPASPTRWITVYEVAAPVPVFERGALTAGQGLSGPAIIADPGSTTYLARGWQATVDDHGHLRLRDSAGVC